MGYSRAGFEVVGVDNRPQPRYPFEFIQADAMTFPLEGYDVIHASPPCQAYSVATKRSGTQGSHPDLVAIVRERLEEARLPWIIENVVGSPMRHSVVLCGTSFGLRLQRHRLFESDRVLFGQPCRHKDSPQDIAVLNHGPKLTRFVPVFGSSGGKAPHLWSEAMGIDWMTQAELAQAIPPAYTEFIGEQLMRALTSSAAQP